MTSEELDSLAPSLRPAIEAFPVPLVAVYLYGSRATGENLEDSDYDFAVLAERPLTIRETMTLRDAFRESLPGGPEVDCVDLRRVPPTLATQVLRVGLVLDCSDEMERGMVETRLLSLYAMLNEERSGILSDIAERGSVYA